MSPQRFPKFLSKQGGPDAAGGIFTVGSSKRVCCGMMPIVLASTAPCTHIVFPITATAEPCTRYCRSAPLRQNRPDSVQNRPKTMDFVLKMRRFHGNLSSFISNRKFSTTSSSLTLASSRLSRSAISCRRNSNVPAQPSVCRCM